MYFLVFFAKTFFHLRKPFFPSEKMVKFSLTLNLTGFSPNRFHLHALQVPISLKKCHFLTLFFHFWKFMKKINRNFVDEFCKIFWFSERLIIFTFFSISDFCYVEEKQKWGSGWYSDFSISVFLIYVMLKRSKSGVSVGTQIFKIINTQNLSTF